MSEAPIADGITVRHVGPESAEVVAAVVRTAFADRPPLDPPADALAESVDSIAQLLAPAGGLVAERGGKVVATVVLDVVDNALYLRRFGVLPDARGGGVANALVAAAVDRAIEMAGVDRIVVLAREELPATIGFWQRQGFGMTTRQSPYVELARAVPARLAIPDRDAMQDLAAHLATVVRAGDVLVLSGELGAGKTTFTQGLGAALDVRGDITSPTFVIARVHRARGEGPDLVHVDAYRLGGAAELDDLDLDAELDEAVTVVEWGAGLAEALSDAPLEIRIDRPLAAAEDDDETRQVRIDPLGARWLGVGIAPPTGSPRGM